jgi:hypothetical protein
MQLEPLFPLSFLSGISKAGKYLDIKPWVITAIAEEEQKPDMQLWREEPSVDFQYVERLRRIRLLRKYTKDHPLCEAVANRLKACEPRERCCSGACPECGRLLQRWFVRKSKRLIRDNIDRPDYTLFALSIIPYWSIARPGTLHTLDLANAQRRLKYALDKAGIGVLIGGIDFSFNEDKEARYKPFWSPHFYLITSVTDERKLKRQLKTLFKAAPGIPRPVRVPRFHNLAKRRSYAFKMVFKRRIGLTDETRRDGRKCRNTSRQRLRAAERLELFMYLDQIGFEQRLIFRRVEPSIKSSRVRIKRIPAGRHRIRPKSKNGS